MQIKRRREPGRRGEEVHVTVRQRRLGIQTTRQNKKCLTSN